mmetsp:Transcript_90020/g.239166  ORF Transcript_90020/g.239166 Transcript_90020/m.239166 type:complete len:287 (-) Transcript_90020:371-1231(-)
MATRRPSADLTSPCTRWSSSTKAAHRPASACVRTMAQPRSSCARVCAAFSCAMWSMTMFCDTSSLAARKRSAWISCSSLRTPELCASAACFRLCCNSERAPSSRSLSCCEACSSSARCASRLRWKVLHWSSDSWSSLLSFSARSWPAFLAAAAAESEASAGPSAPRSFASTALGSPPRAEMVASAFRILLALSACSTTAFRRVAETSSLRLRSAASSASSSLTPCLAASTSAWCASCLWRTPWISSSTKRRASASAAPCFWPRPRKGSCRRRRTFAMLVFSASSRA